MAKAVTGANGAEYEAVGRVQVRRGDGVESDGRFGAGLGGPEVCVFTAPEFPGSFRA